jgi:hypothetical protein
MNAGSLRRVSPQVAFGALLALFAAAEATIVRSEAFRRAPELLSAAVFADCLLVPLLLGWFLLVRRGLATPRFFLALAGGGLFAASLLLPHPPSYLRALRLLPALAELGLLVWGGIVGRAFFAHLRAESRTRDDVLENVHRALEKTASLPPVLKAMTAELVVLWYGLRAFRKKAATGENVFAYHENLTGLLLLGFIATPAEGLVLHVVLRGWSPVAAWIGTALHVYSLVWLIALYQAARLRPIVLSDSTLLVRWSLLWTAEVPLAQIASVEVLKTRPEVREKGVLDMARLADRPIRVRLSEPLTVYGPLGIRRETSALLLGCERPEKLAAALEASR